ARGSILHPGAKIETVAASAGGRTAPALPGVIRTTWFGDFLSSVAERPLRDRESSVSFLQRRRCEQCHDLAPLSSPTPPASFCPAAPSPSTHHARSHS